jgi:hypothetical protein
MSAAERRGGDGLGKDRQLSLPLDGGSAPVDPARRAAGAPKTGRDQEIWASVVLNSEVGALLTEDEVAYRMQILDESELGLIGVSPLYHEFRQAIHQPTLEQGTVEGDLWELRRANKVGLRVNLSVADAATPEQAAVTIAHAFLGEYASRVMMHLYEISNDPPNYRSRAFILRLSELLDRMGYSRDPKRGAHHTTNRRKLARTLLALQFTQVHVEQYRKGAGKARLTGFWAPLLASIKYDMPEEQATLSAIERFTLGLPELLQVTINDVWHNGLRDADGRPGQSYALSPRPAALFAAQPRRGGRPRVKDSMREYLQRCRASARVRRMIVERHVLLAAAGITDKNVTQAGKTLAKALDALVGEGLLVAYAPSPLPLEPDGRITLSWLEELPFEDV